MDIESLFSPDTTASSDGSTKASVTKPPERTKLGVKLYFI